MTRKVAVLPTAAPTDSGARLVHVVCSCTPEDALCGEDMTGRPSVPWQDYPDDCLVCADLAERGCQNCGASAP